MSSSNNLPVPSIPSSRVVFYVHAVTTIAAPSSAVFSTLLNTATWPEWNTFCNSVTIRSQPSAPSDGSSDAVFRKNTKFTLHVTMDPKKPTKKTHVVGVVTELDADGPAKRVLWAMDPQAAGLISWGLRTERVHEIKDIGDGKCEVRTWECQAGPLAYTVKYMYGERLQQAFETWLEDLKEYAENKGAKK